jgi:hypothetical protein
MILILLIYLLIGGDAVHKIKKLLSNPDTAVSGIKLDDRESSEQILGSHYILDSNNKVLYFSNNQKEKLTLYFHGGDALNEFSEFEVSYNKKRVAKNVLSIKEFKTNNNISLGTTKQFILSKLGDGYTQKKIHKNEVLYYEIGDFKHSAFLRRYNMPHYYAEYECKNDTLIRFKFGFEYP